MRIVLLLFLATFLSGSAKAQNQASELVKPAGGSTVQWVNGEIIPGSSPDMGGSVWKNMAIAAWWSGVETGYINLDWGKLPVPSSGLPDHLIDGFTFTYGTNNLEVDMEEWAVYFFDSCTGWGNVGLMEAGFLFTGLPGDPSSWMGGLGWVWVIQVDLDGSGYEFLLDQDFGLGMSRMRTPLGLGGTGTVLGDRPNAWNNGPTGTENAFDIYYPNLKYNGTWWFGSYYWATWTAELFGSEGESDMTFNGVGAQGNDAGLHATGIFTGGGTTRFLLRRNGLDADGYLIASLSSDHRYIGGAYDLTRLTGPMIASFPRMMTSLYLGDFFVLNVDVPAAQSHMTVYFQGILDEIPALQPPLDASNGLRAN